MPALDRPAPSTRSVGRTAPPTAAVHRHNGSNPVWAVTPKVHFFFSVVFFCRLHEHIARNIEQGGWRKGLKKCSVAARPRRAASGTGRSPLSAPRCICRGTDGQDVAAARQV